MKAMQVIKVIENVQKLGLQGFFLVYPNRVALLPFSILQGEVVVATAW